ncbi:MAG: exosortase C-terminal domain/associated protein EpsI [Gemmatimonadaceae bacterium]
MNEKVAQFLPAGVLLVGVMFISGIREQFVVKPAEPMSAIPAVFEGVTGVDVAIAAEEQRIAGMDQFMFRDFKIDSTQGFSIYVGYYDRQVQGKTIHSPKNCLPGAGWDIMANDAVPLSDPAPTAPRINRVVLSNKGQRALVYYWYQGRGRIAANEYRVKWDLPRDAALYGRTEEALVRIVIYVGPSPAQGSGSKQDTALVRADSLALRVASPLAKSVFKVLPAFGAS